MNRNLISVLTVIFILMMPSADIYAHEVNYYARSKLDIGDQMALPPPLDALPDAVWLKVTMVTYRRGYRLLPADTIMVCWVMR